MASVGSLVRGGGGANLLCRLCIHPLVLNEMVDVLYSNVLLAENTKKNTPIKYAHTIKWSLRSKLKLTERARLYALTQCASRCHARSASIVHSIAHALSSSILSRFSLWLVARILWSVSLWPLRSSIPVSLSILHSPCEPHNRHATWTTTF